MRADQLIVDHRMRLLGVVAMAPSIREGCRRAGIHHSTYYAWLRRLERDGLEGLAVGSSRMRAKSPGRVWLESEVVALALGHPPWGPARLHAELVCRGVPVGSVSQVWRILRAHALNTRRDRFRTMMLAWGLAAADRERLAPAPPAATGRPGRLAADRPGDLVQMDCFHLGRVKEARLGAAKTSGTVWQYTAIDVASSFVWAEIHTTARNPSAVHTTALALRVADDLAGRGWTLRQVSTDRGNEFLDHRFADALAALGVTHRLIPAGRPQSNGKVEGVQNIILQECWKPALISYVEPSVGGLRADLDTYLNDYNTRRPHHGRWNQGQPPITIIEPNTGNQP